MCTFPFFFFQAEDGIRDTSVTGVQTCALPISTLRQRRPPIAAALGSQSPPPSPDRVTARRLRRPGLSPARSEERRVGKECRFRWSPYSNKKKKSMKRIV